MKRFVFLLCFLLATGPGFAADQWAKGKPAGTDSPSDIDDLIGVNNAALDRLLYTYREGAKISYSTAAQVSVGIGAIALPNSDGSVVRWRRNTSATTVTWANIDTGSEANSTTYYIYGVADTDATTFTCTISTNASAPTGKTYYRLLGSFYNDSSGNISNISNDNDYFKEVGGWVSWSGSTINDSYNVTSVAHNSTGNYTITWDVDFPNAHYAPVCAPDGGVDCFIGTKTTGTTLVTSEDHNEGGARNMTTAQVIAVGGRV